MTYLGIDYGAAHVGVATGDDEMKIAMPLTTFSNLPSAELLSELKTLIGTHRVDRVVVGQPRSLHANQTGSFEQAAKDFAQALGEGANIPVELADERFTSDQAARLRQDSSKVDEHALAAMLILQSYLDSLP